MDELSTTIDDYLCLVPKIKKLGLIKGGDNGDIILNPELKNKIYSRVVFIVKSEYEMAFGYNINLGLVNKKVIWH